MRGTKNTSSTGKRRVLDRLSALGTRLKGKTPEEWASEAGLDWEAVLRPVEYTFKGQRKTLDSHSVICRSDTGYPFAVPSSSYHPVQPLTVLQFFDRVIRNFGGFEMKCAGMMHGGAQIWAVAKYPETFKLAADGNDTFDRELILATSFDRSLFTTIGQSFRRYQCSNRMFLHSHGVEATMVISHRTILNVDNVLQRMALDRQWDDTMNLFDDLARRKFICDSELRRYFMEVYYPLEKRTENFSEKAADRKVDELVGIYRDAPGQDTRSARGTVWGALNAVTYHEDHVRRSRLGEDQDQFRSIFGRGADLKRHALAVAQRSGAYAGSN